VHTPERSAAVCPEAFPADPDFPQLEIASDPQRMLELFRAHLKPVPGKVCHIEGCVPFRFRCRQSTSRCVLQYTLRIVEPGTGRRWHQWVTGLVYARKGEAERLWQEMQALDPRQGIPERWLTFEPVDFIPDLQMVVQLFPYDRKLLHLPLVMGEAARLGPLLLDRLEPGRWHADAHILEPTRYRTELGAALKYTIQAHDVLTASRRTVRFYLKVYRNERGGETFDLLRSLSERTGEGRGAYAVVRPVAYLSELRCLVLEEAPGTSLQEMLLQGADPGPAMRAVARAVAAFNQDDLRITRHDALADQLDDVTRASSLLQWACPEWRVELEAIAAAVVQGLEEVPPVPIHRDLKTDHIFLSGDRVMFIDLDSAVLGDPVRDPAHLYAHIAARVGLDSLPLERARAAAALFAEEYFGHVPMPWRQWFPLHCAGALIEVARGIFKRQESEWPRKVGAAIEEARRVLAGGFR
jgi:hypothetical protein